MRAEDTNRNGAEVKALKTTVEALQDEVRVHQDTAKQAELAAVRACAEAEALRRALRPARG